MLKDILLNKKCFKLVCGAGNEDTKEIEKLVALYAKAGANFFDLAASIDVIKAAKRGFKRVIPEKEIDNYHLCVSVGTKDDQHISKARIDETKCISCGNCIESCPREAILLTEKFLINTPRCIGCKICESVCPVQAISFYSQ